MMHISSKAAIKRIPIGTQLRLVNSLLGPCSELRKLVRAQSNAVAFIILDGPRAGKDSWLYLDQDDQSVEPTAKGFRMYIGDKVSGEYEFVEAS